MKIVFTLCMFLFISIPIQSVILTKEIASDAGSRTPERQLGQGNDFVCLILVFLFIYMIFNGPVWAMALVTAPFIFASANAVFPSKSRRLLANHKINKSVKRILKQQDRNLYNKVRSNLSQMNLFQMVKGRKIDQRILAGVAHSYFNKFRPNLPQNFHH